MSSFIQCQSIKKQLDRGICENTVAKESMAETFSSTNTQSQQSEMALRCAWFSQLQRSSISIAA